MTHNIQAKCATFTGHLQYRLMTFANDTFIILYLKKKTLQNLVLILECLLKINTHWYILNGY